MEAGGGHLDPPEAAGALRFSVAANRDITSLSLHGHALVDLCAALS